MKNNFITWLNMLRSVLSLAASQPAIVNSLAAFASFMETLGVKVTNIETKGGLKLLQITGSASEKKAMRLFLCEFTYSLVSRVRAHAQVAGNLVLKEQMSYSLTGLKRIKSPDLAPLCTQLFNIVNPLVPTLASLNITPAEMLLWQSAINNYDLVMNAPRMSIVKRKQLNKSLAAMFNDTMDFVREVCDPASAYFKEHANDFFLEYQSARKLDPTGIHHTRLIVTLVNEIGEPYRGQTITMEGGSQPSRSYIGITDFYGVCIISGIKEDELGYEVTASGSEVETKTFGPFIFERGKSRMETLICQPTFNNIPAAKPQAVKAVK